MNANTFQKIHRIIKPYLKNSPLQYSERLSHKYQAEVFLKREDLQFTRSFKIRGSLYKIIKEFESNKKLEVVCASAGNHAQGVAFACHLLQIKGDIFVPRITPNQKINRIKFFGKENINYISGNILQESFQESITLPNRIIPPLSILLMTGILLKVREPSDMKLRKNWNQIS